MSSKNLVENKNKIDQKPNKDNFGTLYAHGLHKLFALHRCESKRATFVPHLLQHDVASYVVSSLFAKYESKMSKYLLTSPTVVPGCPHKNTGQFDNLTSESIQNQRITPNPSKYEGVP